MTRMQAAHVHGPGDVRLDWLSVPEAGPGEFAEALAVAANPDASAKVMPDFA